MKYIIYILLSFSIINCFAIEDDELIGEWAYADYHPEDSTYEYVEIYYDGDFVYPHTRNFGGIPSFRYEINGDSLFYYGYDGNPDSGKITWKAKLELLDSATIRWTDKEQSFLMYRIDSSEYTQLDFFEQNRQLKNISGLKKGMYSEMSLVLMNYYNAHLVSREVTHYYKIKEIGFEEAIDWLNASEENASNRWTEEVHHSALEGLYSIYNERKPKKKYIY